MKSDHFLFGAAKWVTAAILAQWATIPTAIHFLLAFMVLDFVTGVIAAFVQKRISSTASMRGISKKVLILIVILSAHLMEKAFGLELGLEKIAALGYTANEAISIIENCANAGVWVPPQIVEALAKIRQKTDPTHHPGV
jgi:toxin secretion/phage lysis holin